MKVEELSHDAIAIFRLAGELDLKEAPGLKQKLLARAQGKGPRAIVNLAELRYIDSAGLSVLVGALKAYAAAGGKLLLAAPRAEVRHILQITRLDQHFSIHPSEADAIAALG